MPKQRHNFSNFGTMLLFANMMHKYGFFTKIHIFFTLSGR
jgi:hypothetical protein